MGGMEVRSKPLGKGYLLWNSKNRQDVGRGERKIHKWKWLDLREQGAAAGELG